MNNKPKKYRNLIKYGSTALCAVTLLAGICTVTSCNSDTAPTTESSTISVPSTVQNTDFNIAITVKNKEIQLSETDKQKIAELCRKSLENNNSLLNLMMTKEQVESFEKNGLSLTIEYKNQQNFTIMGYPTEINKIQVLIDYNHRYLMFNSREILGDFSDELYEMLERYLN